MRITYETETCSRCGGCGKHSYNQIDGDKCYGCNGCGKQRTRRAVKAAAAIQALRVRLLTVEARQLKAGAQLLYNGKFRPILSVEERPDLPCSWTEGGVRHESHALIIELHGLTYQTQPGAKVQRGPTPAEVEEIAAFARSQRGVVAVVV